MALWKSLKIICKTSSMCFNTFFIQSRSLLGINDKIWASLLAQTVKNLSVMQETQVWFLGWEDPLEKRMATHSNILAWRIPWIGFPEKSMGFFVRNQWPMPPWVYSLTRMMLWSWEVAVPSLWASNSSHFRLCPSWYCSGLNLPFTCPRRRVLCLINPVLPS